MTEHSKKNMLITDEGTYFNDHHRYRRYDSAYAQKRQSYPTTDMGRLITMVSALVGVAVIALPSGIITAAYMNEISKKKTKYEL